MNELYAQIFSRKFVSALSAHRTGNSCTCTDWFAIQILTTRAPLGSAPTEALCEVPENDRGIA